MHMNIVINIGHFPFKRRYGKNTGIIYKIPNLT